MSDVVKWKQMIFLQSLQLCVHLLCCLSCIHIKINIVHQFCIIINCAYTYEYCLTEAIIATVNNKLNKFHAIWYDNRIINASFSDPSSKSVKVLTRHLTEYMPVYTDIVQGMPLDCWPRHCPSPMPKRFTITYSYFYLLVIILLFCSFLAAKKINNLMYVQFR